MSRHGEKSGGARFKRLLGWTVLMAIVFSAGLITGERLVRRKALGPLVSVSHGYPEGQAAADADGDAAEEQPREKTSYSFFDRLTQKDPIALASSKDATGSQADPGETAGAASQKAEPPESKDKPAEADKSSEPASDEKEPQGAPADSAKAEELPARYTLQVAAHPTLDSAKSHMKRLRKMGLEPHVISAAIPDKGKFYRVRVGKFHSMDEARSFQADLERKNSLSTFVSPL